MKMQLLGGVALALILGLSSAAYANPKNSFSNNNSIYVYSNASAFAGNAAFVDNFQGDQDADVDVDGDNDAKAISESYNVSVEAVEVSELSSYSYGYIYQYSGDHGWNVVEWNDAYADASGTLSQASASNGVGNATTQGQSIAAAATLSLGN